MLKSSVYWLSAHLMQESCRYLRSFCQRCISAVFKRLQKPRLARMGAVLATRCTTMVRPANNMRHLRKTARRLAV
jgi:hypothetical protein